MNTHKRTPLERAIAVMIERWEGGTMTYPKMRGHIGVIRRRLSAGDSQDRKKFVEAVSKFLSHYTPRGNADILCAEMKKLHTALGFDAVAEIRSEAFPRMLQRTSKRCPTAHVHVIH